MPAPGPWSQIDPPTPPPRRAGGRRAAGGNVVLLAAAACALVFALTRLYPDAVTTPEQWIGLAGSLGLLVLMGARLLTGHLSAGRSPRHLAIWAGIVVVLAVGFGFRDELADGWARVRSQAVPDAPVALRGGELVIARDEDGEFYVSGQADGRPVRFLIDTGASDIVLSPRDAERLGVDLKALSFGKPAESANGVVMGAAYVLGSLRIGPIELHDAPVSINQAPMSHSLLGMAFLGRMKSFRVEGSRLYIRPNG